MNPSSATTASPRLVSLDALRGFDMMWIVGADAFGAAFEKLHAGSIGRVLHGELEHTAWEGFTFYDLIFPLFVFIVGVAVTLSLDRILEKEGRAAAVRRVLRRTVLLYVIGIFFYGGFSQPVDQIRWVGVLQRIALCYGAASLLYLTCRPRTLVMICVALLVGYWALLTFVPVPGYGAGDFAEGHNLTNWLDREFLPGRHWDGDHDPEGLLSTLPAIATALLGVFAGLLLRDTRRSETSRAGWLAAAGVALVLLGEIWGLQFPVIKKIWTSSYVLVAGGWSVLLLAGFYWIIDVRKVRGWAKPFVWLGTNAITIYVLSNVADFWALSKRFVGGDVATALDSVWPGFSGLALALVSVALCMLVCRFLYQRSIFLRL